MTKEQYLRQLPQKLQNKRLGKHWAKLYGMLLGIHPEIDPIIKKRDEVLEKLETP
jgi:hypothetical protein